MFPSGWQLRHCCIDSIMTQFLKLNQREELTDLCVDLSPVPQHFMSKAHTIFFLSSAISSSSAFSKNVSTASSLFNFLSAILSVNALIFTFTANSGNLVD